jgi:hypothetical protein
LTFVLTLCALATPFVPTLAEQGKISYPLFGLGLTRNTTGTLSIGAIDSSVVKNVSDIAWNQVVPFAPFGSESNSSSYLQWAIHLSSFGVRIVIISSNSVLNIASRSMEHYSHLYLHIPTPLAMPR